jgi:uncharacterized membrane protein SpoIIM required for sporulation
MRADEFYQSRKGEWDTLSRLLDQSQRDMHGLSETQVRDMARLYRATTSDLALAKRDYPRSEITAYLNQLVARAHSVVYRSEPLAVKGLLQFATTGFPRLFRETWIFTFIAAMLFLLPAIASGIATYESPATAALLLPPEMHRLIGIVEDKQLWIDIPVEERPYTSAFIMRNNIQVAMLAFASGLTAGLLTLWILFMAGGSGLMLGWAILRPGLMRRRDALSQAARKSVYLLLGAVPWLVVAGTIEGFISPSETIPVPVKWTVGILSGIFLYGYLLLAGRERKRKAPAQS